MRKSRRRNDQVYLAFRYEKLIRKKIKEYYNDPPDGRSSSGHLIDNPTMAEAMHRAIGMSTVKINEKESLDYPERWMKVVDRTYHWCDKYHLDVARQYYAGVPWMRTCMNLNISNTTRRNLLAEVEQRALLYAVQEQLISL